MASLFTHVAVAVAGTGAGPAELRSRRLVVCMALAAALPDLDVLGLWAGVPYDHPLGHRGFSHSLLFAALLAPIGARVAAPTIALCSRSGGILAVLLFAATASHGALDALTDGGLGVGFLVPFDNERFFWPWRPLRVSTLDPARFFSAHGRAVLRSELVWVWLPVALAAFAMRAWQRLRVR